MSGSHVLELSDDALEGVAGGSDIMSINDTHSLVRPAAAGPSAGPAGGNSFEIESAGGEICLDPIFGLLKEAGTFDQYYRDVSEYTEQCKAWDKKYFADPFKAGPEPKPPNPYDYL